MLLIRISSFIFRPGVSTLFILLFSIKLAVCGIDTGADLMLLTEDGEEYRTNGTECPFGSYFYKEPRPVDCICSKGLWIFYEGACGYPTFIQGSKNILCTSIDFEIRKSLLISDTVEPSFSVIHPTNGITVKIFENSITTPFALMDYELIISSGEWTLLFYNGKTVCLGKAKHFCLYGSDQLQKEEIDSVFIGCHQLEHTPFSRLVPQQCHEFLTEDTKDSKKCLNDRRGKRQTLSRFARESEGGSAQGRAYIPTSMAMNPEFVRRMLNGTWFSSGNGTNNTLPVDDEDHENVTRNGNPIIKSQIWNYLTERATEVLQLYDSAPTAKNIKVPAFKFLEVAKEIMQNRCPEHYVPKTHFDLSVSAFRAIQLREILYDEVPITHAEVERIMKVLNECKNKTNEPFPFIRQNRTCNDSNPLGVGAVPTEAPFETMGQFSMFEQEIFLDVPNLYSPDTREPLIDTVWNIFIHAHSLCFTYFNRSSYNDHHKFSTVMMSLFTNGILDLWTEITELDPDIYSGFLGDAVVRMHRVVHCAASSRLDNDTTYPWDLRRPEGKNATAKQPDQSNQPSQPNQPNQPPPPSNPGTRKKRRVPKYYDLRDEMSVHQGCLGNIRENSFVCSG